MYGWIIDILERHIASKYGREEWEAIRGKAAELYRQKLQEENASKAGEDFSTDFDDEDWIVYRSYPDVIIFTLVETAASVLAVAASVLLEGVGRCLLETARAKGYGKMLQCQGKSLREWLSNISETHSQFQFTVGQEAMSNFPEFFCGEIVEDEGGLTNDSGSNAPTAGTAASTELNNHTSNAGAAETTATATSTSTSTSPTHTFLFHYRSKRGKFFAPMVLGVVKEGAKVLFGVPDLEMERLATQGEDGSTVTTWRVHNILGMSSAALDATGSAPVGLGHHHSSASTSGLFCPMSSHTRKQPNADTTAQQSNLASSAENVTVASGETVEKDKVAPTIGLSSSPLVLEDGGLTGVQVKRLFPFHITIDTSDFTIQHFGERLHRLVPNIKVGMKIGELFKLVVPTGCDDWIWSELEMRREASFTLEVIQDSTKGEATPTGSVVDDAAAVKVARLTGGMYVLGGTEDLQRSQSNSSTGSPDRVAKKSAVFLVQPDVSELDDLCEWNLTWSDFPHHSPYKKLVFQSEHLKSETFIGQRSKVEAYATQHLLDMKRTFVRYISHEVRTPLNTCSVGLRLAQEFQHSLGFFGDAPLDPESLAERMEDLHSLFEMVDEIKDSCDVAVMILDDLLLYEQMEGGMSVINSSQQPALKVVYEATKCLTLQAKDASVQLEFTYAPEHFSENELEKPSVFVNVDTKKIAQAIKTVLTTIMSHLREQAYDDGGDEEQGGAGEGGEQPDPKLVVHVSIQSSAENANSSASSAALNTSDSNNDLLQYGSGAQGKVLRVEILTEASSATSTANADNDRTAVENGNSNDAEQADQFLLNRLTKEFDLSILETGQGAGLGLFIARGIIEAHGGYLGVAPASTSSVSDNAITDTAAAAAAVPAADEAGGGGRGGGSIIFMEIPVSKFVQPTRNNFSYYSSGGVAGNSVPPSAKKLVLQSSSNTRRIVAAGLPATALVPEDVGGEVGEAPVQTTQTAAADETKLLLPRQDLDIAVPSNFVIDAISLSASNDGRDDDGDHSYNILGRRQLQRKPTTSFLDEWRSPVEPLTKRKSSGKRGIGRGISTAFGSSSSISSLKSTTTVAAVETQLHTPHESKRPQLSKMVSRQLSRIIKTTVSRRPSFEKLLLLNHPSELGTNSAAGTSVTGDSTQQLLKFSRKTPSAIALPLATKQQRSNVSMTPVSRLSTVVDSGPSTPVGMPTEGGEAVSPTTSTAVKQKSTPPLEILIVDDSDGTRKMLSRLVKMGKFCDKAVEAPDGLQAVELVRQSMVVHKQIPSAVSASVSTSTTSLPQDVVNTSGGGGNPKEPLVKKFDVILMDYVMPVMDGPTATKAIRDLGYDGLIVGVTGNVLPADMDHFKKQGADDVLGKPLKLDDLRRILDKYIATHKLGGGEAQQEEQQQPQQAAEGGSVSGAAVVSGRKEVVTISSLRVQKELSAMEESHGGAAIVMATGTVIGSSSSTAKTSCTSSISASKGESRDSSDAFSAMANAASTIATTLTRGVTKVIAKAVMIPPVQVVPETTTPPPIVTGDNPGGRTQNPYPSDSSSRPKDNEKRAGESTT